jgi:hypothetical protein
MLLSSGQGYWTLCYNEALFTSCSIKGTRVPDVLLCGGQGSPSPGPQVPQGGAQSTTLS